MTTDTTVNNLIINTMTQAQYNQITPDPNQLYMVTDSTITSSEVTNALGYTPTSPANVDGQWVYSYSELETSGTARSFTVNLGTTGTGAKNYLPADNYSYLVQLAALGTQNGSAAALKLVIGNNVVTLLKANKDSAYSNNAFFVVVDSNRTFGLQITAGFSSFGLYAIGYRRLGTNT